MEFVDKEDAPKGIRGTVGTGPAKPKGAKGGKNASIYMCRQKDSLVKTTNMKMRTIWMPVINVIMNQLISVT